MVLTVDKCAQRWEASCSVVRKGQFLPYGAEKILNTETLGCGHVSVSVP